MHNNLRITRILKSLGELGFEHYQAPLVRFFLEETLVKKTLSSVKRSVLDYFLFAVLDKHKRQELVRFAYLHFEPKDKFVWCPRKVQKLFRKAEKRPDTIGNGDGKEEVFSRVKGKDGEAALQQKEDGLDSVAKAQKGTVKTAVKDKSKPSEPSPEPKPESEVIENGSVETECNNEILGNGNDFSDDVNEMEHSPSNDTVTGKSESCADSELKSTSNSNDQDGDINMQTEEDVEPEKPPKKKREDNKVLPSNGLAGGLAGGQIEEKAVPSKATGQTSPSVQTPHKTSKHSPSLSSEREEKIPRTDFNQVPHKKEADEMLQDTMSATNGALMKTDNGVDEQTNGKEPEDIDMESNPTSSDQNVGNSLMN